MSTKRKTKAQREAEQKAELYRRVHDVYCGAKGQLWDGDDFATAQHLSLVVPALRDLFAAQHAEMIYPWQPHCLSHFDTADTATEFLYAQGYRA